LAAHGTMLRLSFPNTSAQNGKSERILRTLNNSVRTLLLHASMPPSYWVEALSTACYLLNRRPSSCINSQVPPHVCIACHLHMTNFRCLGAYATRIYIPPHHIS
jgi:hypothetical protein